MRKATWERSISDFRSLEMTPYNRMQPKGHDMNSPIIGLRVASAVFGLMALGQLLRLVIRPEVLVAGHPMPLWPSALALVILGGLSLWLWQLSRTGTR